MIRQIAMIAILAAIIAVFSGCQTVHGIGGDLKWTGEQIEAGAANCTVPPPDQSKTK